MIRHVTFGYLISMMSSCYIRDVSFVCLYVHHMQLSCGIKSILTCLLIYIHNRATALETTRDLLHRGKMSRILAHKQLKIRPEFYHLP